MFGGQILDILKLNIFDVVLLAEAGQNLGWPNTTIPKLQNLGLFGLYLTCSKSWKGRIDIGGMVVNFVGGIDGS